MGAGARLIRVLVVAIAASPAFGAEPLVVDAPWVVVGDRWEFAGTRNGKPSTYTIEVIERGDDGRIRVKVDRSGQESTEYRDATMQYLYGGRLEYPQVVARFPLRADSAWRFDQATGSSNSSYTGEGRVVAQRTLTVPAGTFECLEVEAEARYSVGRSSLNTLNQTRWYCPAVKWYAQEAYRSTNWSAYNPADTYTNQGENRLVKFTPGTR